MGLREKINYWLMTGHADYRIKLKSTILNVWLCFLNYSDKGSLTVRLSVGNHLIAFLISLDPFVQNFIDS